MDGSDHDWFEGRGPRSLMMLMVDDATTWTHARLFESESTFAAMTAFAEYVGDYGMPRELYVDRASIYETTRDSTTDEALREASPETQFSRAMRELGSSRSWPAALRRRVVWSVVTRCSRTGS